MDPDSTLALLNGDLPSVPNQNEEDSEDEIFFGDRTDKELNGKGAKLVGRRTLTREDLERVKRRSFQVSKNAANVSSTPGPGWRDRKTVFVIDDESRNDKENQTGLEPLDSTHYLLTGKKPQDEEEEPASNLTEDVLKPLEELDLNQASPTKSRSREEHQDEGEFEEDNYLDRSRSPLNLLGRVRDGRDSLRSIEEDDEEEVDRPMDGVLAPDTTQESMDNDRTLPQPHVIPESPPSLSQPQAPNATPSPAKKNPGYCPNVSDISSVGVPSPNLSGGSRKSACNLSLNSSTSSEWFNNTHDELVLYEKFGEEYEDVLRAMDNHEKRALKREVAKTVAKTPQELLGEIDEDDEAEHTFQSNGGDYDQYHEPCNSSFEPYAQPPVGIQVQPPTPKPRTHTPQKNPREEEPEVKKAVEKFSPRLVQSAAALKMLRDDLALALSEDSPEPVPMKQSSVTRKEKTPSPKVLSQQLSRSKVTPQATMMNTMPKVTPANRGGGGDLNHGMFKTPSTGAVPKTPRSQPGSGGSGFSRTPLPKGKFPTPVYITPRSRQKTPSYLRPTSASKHRQSPRKDPVTNETMDITLCNRHGHTHTHACDGGERFKRKLPSSIDMNKIVSPVGRYIHGNPVPPLIRQVKPLKSGCASVGRQLEALAAEEAAETSPRSQHQFQELPEATYKSSKVALEKKMRDGVNTHTLPKSFPKVDSAEAVVVRHLGRERVPSELRNQSPSTLPKNFALKHQQVQNRDSLAAGAGEETINSTQNETFMEMSIHEVKKITQEMKN